MTSPAELKTPVLAVLTNSSFAKGVAVSLSLVTVLSRLSPVMVAVLVTAPAFITVAVMVKVAVALTAIFPIFHIPVPES
ncbi:hypothetical protein FLA105534_01846 [Flavobacterium bizetiae]|nr:hypothetical protein FLA105534_01846 [Flavobacterium bizetiae]